MSNTKLLISGRVGERYAWSSDGMRYASSKLSHLEEWAKDTHGVVTA